MSTSPLFYKNIVPLSKEKHSNLYITPVENYKHTKDTNSLYIAAIEFLKASREYPIVFAMSNSDEIFPAVLLGLRGNQNLYVNARGKWLADYIPAYVRRYPFILASGGNDEGNFAVCIDESYSGFNKKKKGQRLFEKNGAESETLKQSVEFMQEYQNQIQLTTEFCNKIKELNIMEPMHANVELTGGEKLSLGGFVGVSRTRLKALPAEKLVELVTTDQMELICAHLNSLENLNLLMERIK